MFSDEDILYMSRALQLAQLGGVNAAPNPMVGAVIVYNDKIIGEGYHQMYGEAHAEVNAINAIEDKSLLKEATIYVTLEPCAHHGKTPPCADLVVKHDFKRVVVACQDTFAEVAGKGIERIEKKGIQVQVGLLKKEARAVNKRFFTFHEKKRPYVILKWAQTEDGFIDKLPKERDEGVNWISSPQVKPLVHKWRSEEQAIMVGWKTVKNDDPALTVREVAGKSPHRFIIDPECNTPIGAKVLTDGNPTTLYVKSNNFSKLSDHIEIIELEKFDSPAILDDLYQRNILSVFIEGGANTLEHFISSNLWDEARILQGATTFNEGLPAPKIEKIQSTSTEKIGTNKITYLFN